MNSIFIHVLVYIENHGLNQHFLSHKIIPIETLLVSHIQAFEELELQILILKMRPPILALNQAKGRVIFFCIIAVTVPC